MGFGDTDSIVYIHRPGLSDPLLGDYLGNFKDKLNNGDYIVEFPSGVPKTTAMSPPKVKKSVQCAVCPSTVKGPIR